MITAMTDDICYMEVPTGTITPASSRAELYVLRGAPGLDGRMLVLASGPVPPRAIAHAACRLLFDDHRAQLAAVVDVGCARALRRAEHRLAVRRFVNERILWPVRYWCWAWPRGQGEGATPEMLARATAAVDDRLAIALKVAARLLPEVEERRRSLRARRDAS